MAFIRINDGDTLPASKINELQVAMEDIQATTYAAPAVDALLAGITQDVDHGVQLSPMMSGIYYSSATHGMGRTVGSTMSTMTLTINRVVVTPIWIPHTVNLDLIGINIVTAVASSTVRLGLFTLDLNTKVATRLIDAGAVGGDTTGSKGITISTQLSAGLYWLGLNASHAGIGVHGDYPVRGFGVSNTSGALYTTLVRDPAPYGAFGATESVPTWSTSMYPNIYVRVA